MNFHTDNNHFNNKTSQTSREKKFIDIALNQKKETYIYMVI